MEEGTLLYTWRRKSVWLFVTILTLMVAAAVFQCRNGLAHSSAEELETAVNTTLGENLELYAGVFSTAVTTSVNPTATLAALAMIGTIENADVYFPNSEWLVHTGEFLKGIPLVRAIGGLPISNPTAAVLLTVIAVAMYLVHATSVSKILSKTTIDNIEKWGGMIVAVSLSLLPLASTQVVMAAEGATRYVSAGTYAASIVLSILSAVFTAVVYICVYSCIDAVEVIGAAIPIKGINFAIELLKAALHLALILLQLFSPALSVICSVLLMCAGAVMFHKMDMLTTYYTYIYIKPLWKNIWHRREYVPLVHKKFPKRGRKKYPEAALAVPVFSMNPVGKIKKRELAWLVVRDDTPYMVRLKGWRRIVEMPLHGLAGPQHELYMQKTFRFTRIMTEDKQIELIISNEYGNQWKEMLERLKLSDFKAVEESRRKPPQKPSDTEDTEHME